MSIRFGCPKCQHVMSVADGNEGRKTKCPQCQTILKIPGIPAAGKGAAATRSPGDAAQPKPQTRTPSGSPPAGQAKPAPQAKPASSTKPAAAARPQSQSKPVPQRPAAKQPPPNRPPAADVSASPPAAQQKPKPKSEEEDPFGLAGLDLGGPGNPFDDLPAASNSPGGGTLPSGDFSSNRPFESPGPATSATASPGGRGRELRENAQLKLMGPALGLIFAAFTALVWQIVHISSGWGGMTVMSNEPEVQKVLSTIFYVTFIGLSLIRVLMLMGATAALFVRFPGLVWTGFILGAIPCAAGYVCVISMPFSIWGIVVMFQKDVKSAFEL